MLVHYYKQFSNSFWQIAKNYGETMPLYKYYAPENYMGKVTAFYKVPGSSLVNFNLETSQKRLPYQPRLKPTLLKMESEKGT